MYILRVSNILQYHTYRFISVACFQPWRGRYFDFKVAGWCEYSQLSLRRTPSGPP